MSVAAARSRAFAFRGAIALMVIALIEAIVGFLIPAVDLMILLVTGAEPNVPEGPGVSTLEMWRGLMPITVPWWLYLTVALSLGGLLVLTYRPERQYRATMHGNLLLRNTPFFLAFWAFLWAGLSLGSTMYFTTSGVGLYWIPSSASLIVFVAAIILGLRQRSAANRPARKRSARAS